MLTNFLKFDVASILANRNVNTHKHTKFNNGWIAIFGNYFTQFSRR